MQKKNKEVAEFTCICSKELFNVDGGKYEDNEISIKEIIMDWISEYFYKD